MSRRPFALTLATVATVAALTSCGDATQGEDPGATTAPTSQGGASGACAWHADGSSPAAPATVPGPEEKASATRATMETDRGTISFSLDTTGARCTTLSLQSLAAQQYFDDTVCHRLTTDPALSVLQCGDPSASGSGGPGYTIPDELTSAEALKDSPAGVKVYPAGTVAMANTGQPDSGGSQFFLVYADSQLPPSYTVFGEMDEASLDVVKKIASGGLAADGTAPATTVTISSLVTS